MEEIWKDIPEFESLYQANQFGEFRRFKKQRWVKIKPWLDGRGYERVSLSKNGIRYVKSCHRIVAQLFCDNPNNYPVVNHIDENKQNNIYTNLEWVTYEMNDNHGTRNSRISMTESHQKLEYIMMDDYGNVLKIWKTTRELKKNGFNPANIRTSIKKGWKSMGYYWKTIRIK